MSLKDTDVRTMGNEAIAKKFKLSLARVRQLVAVGAKHEKEHNTNQKKAEEVARDHIGERPDYYKMLKKAEKTKVSMKEEMGVGGVRGLGYVSGDPAGTNYVDQYVNTNAMAYEDQNGNKLEWIKKMHTNLHNDKLGYNFFNPTEKGSNRTLKEMIGMYGAEGTSALPPRTLRKSEMEEGKTFDRLKKSAKVGALVGALGAHGGKIYDVTNVATHHDDPGLAAATMVANLHPASRVANSMTTALKASKANAGENEFARQKKYKSVKENRTTKGETYPSTTEMSFMREEDNSKGVDEACWKGYEMVGMKKKGNRKVPNCVPVKEGWASIGHAYDWAGDRNPKAKFVGDKPKPTTTKNDEKDDTYKGSKQGGKVKFSKPVKEDWQSVNRKDKTDGLSQKAVNAYKRENPGSKLQTAVTEKNPTGKRASRRKSFCSRMGGMKKRLTSAKTARDPDSRINKALRRWNCEESVINELKAETLGSYTKKASASRKKSLEGSKPDIKTWAKRQKGITTAVKKLTSEEQIEIKEFANVTTNEYTKPYFTKSLVRSTRTSHEHIRKPDTVEEPGGGGRVSPNNVVKEESKMDNKALINEAIDNIIENNLSDMKENFMAVLEEKAMEKLEEKKKAIAANYFAQD